MKKLIFAAVFLMTSLSCYADFGIRLGGGVSLTKLDNKDFFVVGQKPVPSHVFSAKAFKDVLKLEVGIGADVLKLTTKGTFPDSRLTYANPAIPVYGFVIRKHGLPKLDLYYGLSLGYMFNTSNDRDSDPMNRKFLVPKSNGFTAGVQLGSTFKITKSLGINAEAAARLARLGYLAITSNPVGKLEEN